MTKDLRHIGIKCQNYKCFGNKEEGFDKIELVNVIIGKNSSGKTSLVELIEAFEEESRLKNIEDKYIHKKQRLNKPIFFLTKKLTPDYSKYILDKNEAEPELRKKFKDKAKSETNKVIKFYMDNSSLHLHDSFTLPNWCKNKCIYENPFQYLSIERLSPERNIKPQKAILDIKYKVSKDGENATELVRAFRLNSQFETEMIEKFLLEELNTICRNYAEYEKIDIQQIDNAGNFEIYLKEKYKGEIPLSQSGYGLQTILLVLIKLHLVPKFENKDYYQYFFVFEEIENGLHPSLQRNLFKYIIDAAIDKKFHIFITTHSSIAIDLASSEENTQILHVVHNGENASVKSIKSSIGYRNILRDLGTKASDILQSNGVIWVEGPSDRIYIKKWIDIWSDGILKEGFHYQCLFYGGKILSHFGADNQTNLEDRIELLKVNINSILVMDKDVESETQINETKKRICKEFEEEVKDNGFVWITEGIEIENYIPQEVINKYFGKNLNDMLKNEKFSTYLEKVKQKGGKIEIAIGTSKLFEKKMIEKNIHLKSKLDKICKHIRNWNNISNSKG